MVILQAGIDVRHLVKNPIFSQTACNSKVLAPGKMELEASKDYYDIGVT